MSALGLALVLALQGVPAAVDAPDIVVIGRRLAAVSVTVGRDARGRFTCSLSQSSGNVPLDSQLCRVAAKCVSKGAADHAAVSACIDRRKPALLEDVRRTMTRGTSQ